MKIVHQSESRLVLRDIPYMGIVVVATYFTALLSFTLYAFTVPYYFDDGWNMFLIPLLFFFGTIIASVTLIFVSFTFDKSLNTATEMISSIFGRRTHSVTLSHITSIRATIQLRDHINPDLERVIKVPNLEFYARMKDGSDATLFRYIGNGWTDPVKKNFFMTKLQFSNTQGKEIEVCRKIAVFLNVPFVMQFTNAVSKIEDSLSNT